jgi:ribosomal protein S27E
MAKKKNTIKVQPIETGIEKIMIECLECGEFHTFFGRWKDGEFIQTKCRKCKKIITIEIDKQMRLV